MFGELHALLDISKVTERIKQLPFVERLTAFSRDSPTFQKLSAYVPNDIPAKVNAKVAELKSFATNVVDRGRQLPVEVKARVIEVVAYGNTLKARISVEFWKLQAELTSQICGLPLKLKERRSEVTEQLQKMPARAAEAKAHVLNLPAELKGRVAELPTLLHASVDCARQAPGRAKAQIDSLPSHLRARAGRVESALVLHLQPHAEKWAPVARPLAQRAVNFGSRIPLARNIEQYVAARVPAVEKLEAWLSDDSPPLTPNATPEKHKMPESVRDAESRNQSQSTICGEAEPDEMQSTGPQRGKKGKGWKGKGKGKF